ncbi:MAG: cupin domain-containing protein, partial [Chloroflexi bacterium]|nr:cupin domain-containing protein [Chloroflexota bacterium]
MVKSVYNHPRIVAGHREGYVYDKWVDSLGLPVHKGYYIEDLRTVELAPWEEFECNAAIIQLEGMKGVAEAKVLEIPGGGAIPGHTFAIDEVFFVLEGHGFTTVWTDENKKHTFEWGPRALFLIPQGVHRSFSNARGDQPAKLAANNYLPMAMAMFPDPKFFYSNSFADPNLLEVHEGDAYSVATRTEGGRGATWKGNFFTDLGGWDGLVPHRQRGGGGHVVDIEFPNSEMGGHMSVFPNGTYKKGHRHGPGVVIIIPAGEGFSVMWPEGEEQVMVPWHEASMFVPPNRWFHQHFNISTTPARYLALSPLRQTRPGNENFVPHEDQIEYPDEAPWIRDMFKKEVEKRGGDVRMPEAIYTDY